MQDATKQGRRARATAVARSRQRVAQNVAHRTQRDPLFGAANRLSSGDAGVAQLVEHFTRNEGVIGSSPIAGFA